jgi:hypothetical protein
MDRYEDLLVWQSTERDTLVGLGRGVIVWPPPDRQDRFARSLSFWLNLSAEGKGFGPVSLSNGAPSPRRRGIRSIVQRRIARYGSVARICHFASPRD